MRSLGAEVVEHGADFDEARERCAELAAERGARYIHSGDEPLLIAGVATATLEVLSSRRAQPAARSGMLSRPPVSTAVAKLTSVGVSKRKRSATPAGGLSSSACCTSSAIPPTSPRRN